MTEREKVIKGLECCLAGTKCGTCPYNLKNDLWCGNIDWLLTDAIALLKAQEQKPISASIVDSDSGLMHWWACGNCQAPINPEDRFCHECGMAVKWE